MTGFSDVVERQTLDNLFNQTLYLVIYSGTTAGDAPLDNGTLPAGMTELSTNGWSRKTITGSMWNAAVAGAPTLKSMPTGAASPVRWTPTALTTGVCAWALLSHATNPISSSNLVYSGVFVDTLNAPILHTVAANSPFDITSGSPLTARLGDAPNGTNPT